MKALALSVLSFAAGALLVVELAARTVTKAQLQVGALAHQLIECEGRPVSP